jgi:hypothetical protein
VGLAVTYPAASIEKDFAYCKNHPLAEAYRLYNPPPHERPCWDLTSVLYAVYPERKYFGLSGQGQVTVGDDGVTRFASSAKGASDCGLPQIGGIEAIPEFVFSANHGAIILGRRRGRR